MPSRFCTTRGSWLVVDLSTTITPLVNWRSSAALSLVRIIILCHIAFTVVWSSFFFEVKKGYGLFSFASFFIWWEKNLIIWIFLLLNLFSRLWIQIISLMTGELQALNFFSNLNYGRVNRSLINSFAPFPLSWVLTIGWFNCSMVRNVCRWEFLHCERKKVNI